MRKKLIAANWKMHKTPEQAQAFVSAFLPHVWEHTRDEIVLCPAFVALPAVVEATRDSQIGVGGQDMFWEKEGAYTGAISAPMLRAVGCSHVIIGHSERRQYFGETDETVGKRVQAALEAGLFVIACIGETEEERERNETEDVLRRQLSVLAPDDNLVLAYEPVWAIGTGKTATPEMAHEAHDFIKSQLDVPVLYGGSVKPENAAELLSRSSIDGALVGGASLDLESFTAICRAAIRS